MSRKDGILFLTIKEPWFSMIRNGIKREEYREQSPYWKRRLYPKWPAIEEQGFQHYDQLLLSNGMTKDKEKRFLLDNPKIRIGTGNPEWGAKPEKEYFVITWEDNR